MQDPDPWLQNDVQPEDHGADITIDVRPPAAGGPGAGAPAAGGPGAGAPAAGGPGAGAPAAGAPAAGGPGAGGPAAGGPGAGAPAAGGPGNGGVPTLTVVNTQPRLELKPYIADKQRDYVRLIVTVGLLLMLGWVVVWSCIETASWSDHWAQTKEMLQSILPALTGLIGSVIGFYFGSGVNSLNTTNVSSTTTTK